MYRYPKTTERNTHRYLADIKRMARKWKSPTTKRNEKKKFFDIFGYRRLARCEWVAVENHNAHTARLLYLCHSFYFIFYTRIWKTAEQRFMAGLFRAHATGQQQHGQNFLFRLQNANGNNIKYMHWQCGNFMVRKVYAYTHMHTHSYRFSPKNEYDIRIWFIQVPNSSSELCVVIVGAASSCACMQPQRL